MVTTAPTYHVTRIDSRQSAVATGIRDLQATLHALYPDARGDFRAEIDEFVAAVAFDLTSASELAVHLGLDISEISGMNEPTPAPRTSMSDLQITDAAVHACALAIDPDEDPTTLAPEDIDEIRDALTAVAPYIVAAELRRLADIFISAGSRDEAAVLLGRADELDGGNR